MIPLSDDTNILNRFYRLPFDCLSRGRGCVQPRSNCLYFCLKQIMVGEAIVSLSVRQIDFLSAACAGFGNWFERLSELSHG